MTAGPKPPPPPIDTGPPFDKLPADVLKTRMEFQRRWIRLVESWSEEREFRAFESRRATAAALHAAGQSLRSRPVIVLTAERGLTADDRSAHAKVAALSTNSVRRIVPSRHLIHLEDPNIVVQAIADVVAAVRKTTRLAR